MTRRIHLDTNLLIQKPRFERLAGADCELVISALAYAEFTEGLFNPDPAIAARTALDLIAIKSTYGDGLPFGSLEAEVYREVCSAMTKSGKRINRARRMDLMIAAVAVADGAELATRNVDDFRGLEHYLTVVAL